MKTFFRSMSNGLIFDYDERLKGNPNVEEITEQQAYPDKFIPVDRIADLRTEQIMRGSHPVDLTIPEQEEKPYTPPELAEQAGKRWPR